MDETRRQDESAELRRPEDAVQDLEPDEREGDEVKGGEITTTMHTDQASTK